MMFPWTRARRAQQYIREQQAKKDADTRASRAATYDDELAFRGFQTVEVEEMTWALEHAPNWTVEGK